MPKNNDYILVAGDVIKDVAVYKGDHTSLSDNGAVSPHLSVTHGGAKQLHNIIQRAIGTKAKCALPTRTASRAAVTFAYGISESLDEVIFLRAASVNVPLGPKYAYVLTA